MPPDVWWLLAVIFTTFTLQFFAATAIVPALLRLTPAVWRLGFVWQLATYPFVGTGRPSLWFLLELFILFLFARQVYQQLGRRRFWWTVVSAAGIAALVAVAVQLVAGGLFGAARGAAFGLMQGQHMMVVILVAAFATLNRYATIYLFFVLPIQARWFLPLEILFAFMGFLATKDLAGLVGVCAAVGYTFARLSSAPGRSWWREPWLRLQEGWIRLRLSWLRRRRGLRVIRGDKKDGPGPWVH